MHQIDIQPIKQRCFAFVLMLSCILMYACINCFYLLLILIPCAYFIYRRVSIKQWFIYIIIAIIPLLLYAPIKDYSVFDHLRTWIDDLLHFSIRSNLINYINQSYCRKTACFINLVMFNVKSNEGWTLYDQMIDLSIVYLIVISGFHLSFLKRIIYKMLGKHKTTAYSISITLIFMYLYFLNFATSALRVFISMLVSSILKKKIRSRFDVLGISGLITIAIEPSCAYSLGFGLSYLCTFVIIIVYEINIQNMLLEKIMVNLTATLVGVPFVLLINGYISFWAIINSFIFSYIFLAVFINFLFTFWVIWIYPIQDFIVNAIFFIVGSSWQLNILIYLRPMAPLYCVIYYYMCFFIGSSIKLRLAKLNN